MNLGRWTATSQLDSTREAVSCVCVLAFKAAYHDIDIDTETDSPDTPTREDVGVGVVECGLYSTVGVASQRPRWTVSTSHESRR